MALVNGTNYDHIDLQAAAGGDVTRHKLQDTDGRALIAPTEASSTASAAHAAGSYFIYGGVLYRATADIASGGSIVTSGSGQNCEAVKLGNDVSDYRKQTDLLASNLKFNFSVGEVNAANGLVDTSATNRAYAPLRYVFKDNEGIVCDPSIQIRIAMYSDNEGSFIGMDDEAYYSGVHALKKGTWIRVTARYTANPTGNIPNASAINDLVIPCSSVINGLNLYDPFTIVLNRGQWISADGSIRGLTDDAAISDYIEIDEEKEYVAAANSIMQSIEICWYNASKTFLRRDIDVAAEIEVGKEVRAVPPANAKYARVGFEIPHENGNIITITAKKLISYGCVFMEYSNYIYNEYFDRYFISSASSVFDELQKNNYRCQSSGFEGKRISIMGDSISTFAGYSRPSASDGHLIADGKYTYSGNHCRYPQSDLLQNVHDTYWMQLIESLKMKLGVNESIAGSRVSWDGTSPSGYPELGADGYMACMTRIGHLDDNGTPDIILINGGTNDIGQNVTIGTFNTESPENYTEAQILALDVSTFANAYRAMIIRMQYYYPTATLIAVLPNYTTSYYSAAKADQYCEVIKEVCDYFGVKWIDMRTSGITMFNESTYLPDGIHPNAKGMKQLYKNIAKFFRHNFVTLD